ncbi:HigA family addiction module antitoxin [Larkinella punicea]|jgi:plasmid maintenance system antidote protein VapI|uniref:HigA family addiction module antitoxin n=1 Tax=Larkinella punicea TaxID=2315727 RepID=UPI0026D52FFE
MKRNLAPVHPGEILREEYIQEHGLTITEVAKGLGIARADLSAIVNERAGLPRTGREIVRGVRQYRAVLGKPAKKL